MKVTHPLYVVSVSLPWNGEHHKYKRIINTVGGNCTFKVNGDKPFILVIKSQSKWLYHWVSRPVSTFDTRARSQVIHVFQYGGFVAMSLQVVSLRQPHEIEAILVVRATQNCLKWPGIQPEVSWNQAGSGAKHVWNRVRSRTLSATNALNQVADQRFSLKQWFAGRFAAGAQSCRLRRTGSAHCYLRFWGFSHFPSLKFI